MTRVVTDSDVAAAERFCLEQRLGFAKLLRVDPAKAADPAGVALCSRVAETAEKDPLKFDAMLKNKDVAVLFARGALYFGKEKDHGN
jgi:hypothetical protein